MNWRINADHSMNICGIRTHWRVSADRSVNSCGDTMSWTITADVQYIPVGTE
jgi:hypothetical protein